MLKNIMVVIPLIFLIGCASAGYHRGELRDDAGDKLTVGTVQREITVGMSASQVAEKLGSPNVVTTDEERREVWIYDKIASEVLYSKSGAGLKFLTSGTSGGRTSTQRTLTIVIKFDQDKKVRDFAYHTSRF